MTTMMMTMWTWKTIGKRQTKRTTGIRTSTNLISPSQNPRKQPRSGKKGKEDDDDLGIDDEFKDMGLFDDGGGRFDDDDDDY